MQITYGSENLMDVTPINDVGIQNPGGREIIISTNRNHFSAMIPFVLSLQQAIRNFIAYHTLCDTLRFLHPGQATHPGCACVHLIMAMTRFNNSVCEDTKGRGTHKMHVCSAISSRCGTLVSLQFTARRRATLS